MSLRHRALGAASALAVASLMIAGAASAQVATSTLRGSVYDGSAPETGGTVTARETSTGYVSRGRVSENGTYVLPGLRPGSYEITVTSAEGQTASDTVTLALGQIGTLDLDVGGGVDTTVTSDVGADSTELGDIVVTGRRIFEVRTPEVGTNVSQQQINNLPQTSRNFLNFAALAPGVRVTEGETERTISAGGQTAQTINVFIDGQNQKSNILDGGVAGQDDSRGNPFPQGAVQEFRVISQNFKAEYEQASSSVITAVTRSGTNEFHGDAFVYYQDLSWISQDSFSERRGDVKPELERLQWGLTAGGPIIQDRLHFFGSYERKEETRQSAVFLNRSEFNGLFASELGNYATPFEENLYFGKLSWSIDDRQRLDLSVTHRVEADIRIGSGQQSFARAQEINTEVNSINLRHQYQGDSFLNEFSIDYLSNAYNPTALNFDDFGRRFVIFRDNDGTAPGFQFNSGNEDSTIFTTGGEGTRQEIRSENLTFRNDLTLLDVRWMGEHTIKMGIKYSQQNYYVAKELGRNPQFVFDIQGRPEINGSVDIPVRVDLGVSVPPADVDNNVLGLYIQDDWQITDKLEINLGLRWDYEDNAVNNDYVTPAAIRDTLQRLQDLPNYNFPSYFNPADYITDGRDAYMDAFQPRIGFSYDLYGDESTVLFGGAGRYYDRIGFNFAFDERFKPFQFNKTIYFSRTGGLVGGQQTVAFNPSFLTSAGLDPLLAASPGSGEIFLVRNDAPPPYTDQFNLGVRQKVGPFQTALTLAYGKTKNEFAWYIANALTETGGRFDGPSPVDVGHPEFRDLIFFSNHDREREFKAVYFTADKPYTEESGWGLQFTYTYTDATQNGSRDTGSAAFDFDYNITALTPEYPSATDETHRIVASGTLGLPYAFLLSGIVTLGSGLPYNISNCPNGVGGVNTCFNAARPATDNFIIPDAFAFRQVDLRLTKRIPTFGGQSVELIVDAINIFDFDNGSTFEGDFNNPRFGRPLANFLPTRSFQVGLRYSW